MASARARPQPPPVRLAVLGARRGLRLLTAAARLPAFRIVAVCDRDRRALARCRHEAQVPRGAVAFYDDPDHFFAHDFEAVILANYANEHAPPAIRALRSGRHVLSEVMAVQTLDEAVALVEAVEAGRAVYAYAENYCYLRATLEMRRLYRAGALGEFLHGEGHYVHDCEDRWPELTYGDPDHWRNRRYATFYGSHSLGPLLTITGTRPVRVVGFETPNTGRHYGLRSGSSALECCQMSNGATVINLHSSCFKREPRAVWYAVYGTRGMAECDRWDDGPERLWTYRVTGRGGRLRRGYRPRLPEDDGAGSEGTPALSTPELRVLRAFADRVRGEPGPYETIDVYTALDMTLPGILAFKSILAGNQPFAVPDLRDPAAREPCRGDRFCFDPAVAGDQLAPSCSFPVPPIPARVYRAQRRRYLAALRGEAGRARRRSTAR